jgi:hypothetical protein
MGKDGKSMLVVYVIHSKGKRLNGKTYEELKSDRLVNQLSLGLGIKIPLEPLPKHILRFDSWSGSASFKSADYEPIRKSGSSRYNIRNYLIEFRSKQIL